MHLWLMRYTTSMECEGKRARGEAWRERYLVDRAGSGRAKKGLPPAIDSASDHPVVMEPAIAESIAFIDYQNARLVQAGACPPPPNWSEVIDRAHTEQQRLESELRTEAERRRAEDDAISAAIEASEAEAARIVEEAKQRFAAMLEIDPDAISFDAAEYILMHGEMSEAELRAMWADKPWEQWLDPTDWADGEDDCGETAEYAVPAVSPELQVMVRPGETDWALERNAAAAGFYRVEDYLKWRAEVDA